MKRLPLALLSTLAWFGYGVASGQVAPCNGSGNVQVSTAPSSSQEISSATTLSASNGFYLNTDQYGNVNSSSAVSVTFIAGSTICLGPGFTAAGTSAGGGFKAGIAVPLSISSNLPASGVVGQAYSGGLTAVGGTSPYYWTVLSGSLPAGLALNAATGAVTGTPTTAGPSPVAIQVTDSSNPTQVAAASFTISIVSLSVAPSTVSLGSGGAGTVNISVSAAPSTVSWTAMSSATNWLNIAGAALGTGNGSITLNAAPNSGTSSQTGTVTVSAGGATATVQVTEAGAAGFVSPMSWAAPQGGGTSPAFNVTVQPGVAWSASTSTSWLTVNGGAGGTTSGTFTLTAQANTGTSPLTGSAVVTIGGVANTVTVSQAPATITTSPASESYSASGGSNSIAVSAGGASWTASSSSPSWLTITNMTPSGFQVNAAANTGAARSATVTVSSGGVASAVVSISEAAGSTPAQTVSSTDPREFIRIGSRIIAIDTSYLAPPVVTALSGTTALVNQSLSFLLSGSGSNALYNVFWGDGSSTGWQPYTGPISHAWTRAAYYNVIAYAENSASAPNVQSAPSAPVNIGVGVMQITNSPPNGINNIPYPTDASPNFQMTATGGSDVTSNYLWQLANNSSLPPGLSLSTMGVISGTPYQSGTYAVTVMVQDTTLHNGVGGPFSGQQTFTIVVSAESVTAPSFSGLTTVLWDATGYAYLASGSAASGGEGVQYQFCWGDSSGCSGWLNPTSGVLTQYHTWASLGTFYGYVQARSVLNTGIVSSTVPITVVSEVINAPNTPSSTNLTNGVSGVAGNRYHFTTGGSLTPGYVPSYQFFWGNETSSALSNLGVADNTWNSVTGTGSNFVVTAQSQAVGSSAPTSAMSAGLTVSIANTGPVYSSSSVSPDTGSSSIGGGQNFAVSVMDYAGGGDVSLLQFSAAPQSTSNYCIVTYSPSSNLVHLSYDTNYDGYSTQYGSPGSNTTLSNSACSISLAQMPTPSASGQYLSMTVPIVFNVADTFELEVNASNSVDPSGTSNWFYAGYWTVN